MNQHEENKSHTFNNMVTKIENIIAEISSNRIDLDDVLEKTEEGYKLLKSMKHKLEDAKSKIEQLKNEYNPSDESRQ